MASSLRSASTFLGALAATEAVAPTASATLHYPSPTGSGTACTSVAPCHIVQAIDGANASDDVIVGPGDYTLLATLPVADQITIRGVAGRPRPRLRFEGNQSGLYVPHGTVVRHIAIEQAASSTPFAIAPGTQAEGPGARLAQRPSAPPECASRARQGRQHRPQRCRRAQDDRDRRDDPPPRLMGSSISVLPGNPGAIKQALNASGWLGDEVIAAGQLRQGTGLIELLRPRRTKSLPRHFVLALTADRVVAFKAWGEGGDDEGGPYRVRIRPGERGAWPRASVRLVDLPDGARSVGATLAIAAERLPVSRPNRDGDPSTDELIELLGGTGAKSPPRGRLDADHEALRRASEVRPAGYRELAADAVRGRPDVDLAEWARRRGLRYAGGRSQGGHLSVTCPWSEDLLFNVVCGRWPGGSYGVLCHETRIYHEHESGFFHGGDPLTRPDRGSIAGDILDWVQPLPLGGGAGERYFKVPYTSAGARVPHLARVKGLHVARRAERQPRHDTVFGTWQRRPLDDLGLRDHWVAGVRKNSDERTVLELLGGPIRELLTRQQGLGFEIRIEYGQAIVSRQDFVRSDEDLDALVADAEALARSVRDICAPRGGARTLAARLEPPEWLAPVRRQPRKKHTYWPIGALLERVVQIADERGMAVEDPRAFHAAFPGLNLPGEAFGVLHGRLPGHRPDGATALLRRAADGAPRRLPALPHGSRRAGRLRRGGRRGEPRRPGDAARGRDRRRPARRRRRRGAHRLAASPHLAGGRPGARPARRRRRGARRQAPARSGRRITVT